jgi:hypothetical protein
MPSELETAVLRFFCSDEAKEQGIVLPNETVTVIPHETVLLVDFISVNGKRRRVIKPPGPRWKSRSVSEICRVNKLLRSSSPILNESLPYAEKVGPEGGGWLALDYVEGVSLDTFLSSHATSSVAYSLVFKRLGKIAATLHAIPASRLDIPLVQQSVRDYKEPLEKGWDSFVIKSMLPFRMRTPTSLYRALAPSIWSQVRNQALMVDFQPKNVLVDECLKISLIDPDFASGNPAMNVSFFLNGLSQLAFGHRNWVSPQIVASCQKIFLESYLSEVTLQLDHELAFFFPWTIVETGRLHAARSRAPLGAARLLYTVLLRRYLKRLGKITRAESGPPSAEVFRI